MDTNKRANDIILKNTLLLYARMLVTTIVSLYTSRIVLDALGVEDFGIYNVIAGFVTLLAFINGSMVSATRRFLTFAIAQGDIQEQKITFCTSFYIHVLIGIIIFIVSIMVGFWFIHNKLVIPNERIETAYWVFFYSVINILVLIITVPHNALVIAYEKMGTFAYLSIFDVFFKLLIAYYLLNTSSDRLFIYALLMCISSVFIRVLYVIYCHVNFIDVCYQLPKEKSKIREMLNFAFWNVFSSFSTSGYQHGLNILLNMFFGPALNTARGIAVQVQSAINLLAINFQQAVNPQITKSYALENMYRLKLLVYVSSKASFFLIFIIAVPFILETENILSLWLVSVPDYTIIFTQLSLIITLIDVTTNSITTAVLSSGKIKKYQIGTSIILLSILPAVYIALKNGLSPQYVYYINIFTILLLSIFKLCASKRLTGISFLDFCKNVVLPIIYVVLFTIVLLCIGTYFIKLKVWFVNIIYSVLVVFISILLVGMNGNERKFIMNKIKRYSYE